MSNLLIVFSSFIIPRDPTHSRFEEYAICYEQIARVIPPTFSLIFVDNTIDNKNKLSTIHPRLYNAVKAIPCLFYDNNIGLTNKGLGELDMLISVEKRIDFLSYKKIAYMTGRRFPTCPYVFDRTNQCNKKILVGNQHFVDPYTGHINPLTPNCFEDMYFSMDADMMKEYVLYAKDNLSPPFGVGSEQILYSFVKYKGCEYEELNHLGFIRNNWERWGGTPNLYSRDASNFVVC